MKKLICLLVLFLVLTLIFTNIVLATSCLPPSTEHAFNNADVVFAGKVTKVKFLDNRKKVVEPRIIVTFNVSKVWKGPQKKENCSSYCI